MKGLYPKGIRCRLSIYYHVVFNDSHLILSHIILVEFDQTEWISENLYLDMKLDFSIQINQINVLLTNFVSHKVSLEIKFLSLTER